MLLNHFVHFLHKSPEPVPDSDRGFNFGVMTGDNVAAHIESVFYTGTHLTDAVIGITADLKNLIYLNELH